MWQVRRPGRAVKVALRRRWQLDKGLEEMSVSKGGAGHGLPWASLAFLSEKESEERSERKFSGEVLIGRDINQHAKCTIVWGLAEVKRLVRTLLQTSHPRVSLTVQM